MITILPPTYQAEWTAQNEHLKAQISSSYIHRIGKIAYNTISILIPVILLTRIVGWAVAALCRKATLPAALHYSPQQLQDIRDLFHNICYGPVTDENRLFRENFSIERHAVITPDEKKLSCLHFRHRQSGPDTPTILYFQPNLALAEHFIHSWLIEETIRRGTPCNFVAFDYRGVPFYENEFSRPEDLILDGDSMLQFVQNKLQVPLHLIKAYGWSLGGCISANVKAIHPEWDSPYVNERSFSSTQDIVSAWLSGIQKLLLFWFPFTMNATRWNLKAPIDKVKGPVMIVYHPEDSTIPYDASCHQLAVRTRTFFESVKLTANHFLHLADMMKFRIYHHAHPLKDYVVLERSRQPADRLIADFILEPLQTSEQPISQTG